MDILKPTIGKVISTIVLTFIAAFWWFLHSMIIGHHVELWSVTAFRVLVFVVLIGILYLGSGLIFNNFKWIKLPIFVLCLVIIFFSIYPKEMYYGYLYAQAQDCDSCLSGAIEGPECKVSSYLCECLGTSIGSRCLGETKYEFHWKYANYNGIIFNQPGKMIHYCETNASADVNCSIMASKWWLGGSAVFTTTFSSLEEWQQYCDNLNDGAEKENCYQALSEVQKYKNQ